MESNQSTVREPSELYGAVDLDDDDQVMQAVRSAVTQALRQHKEQGQYITSAVNGKPVIIQPDDIVVPEVE